ncbi:acyltransferase [Flavobacterium columnare]|nr:acyltransferase [Flavobacterium columnare]AMO20271.2 acyltransferase [Flavobacterium columnare]ANO49499.1 acyltransferase 3 [Flavobacterium columnare]MBF6651853.1 acyltransferase [Flavobacterium columnare]MBF6655490.1 acyltransferase [Flavobacterium columnare]MBF6658343.1 acyltransferase [Flavobacterium columnare]
MLRKNSINFLRFLMANIILLAHLAELTKDKSLHFLSLFCKSNLAVSGFFILSGFLVTKSLVNTPNLKMYFLKRAKRILPAYITIIILSVIILSALSTLSYQDYFTNRRTYRYFFWNLFFLNFVEPCLPSVFTTNPIPFINGSLWTMKIEEGFYIVLPMLFYLINKFKNKNTVLVFIYLASILYSHVMLEFLHLPLLEKQLPGKLAYFVMGIYIYLNFDFFIQNKWKFLIGAWFLFLIQMYGLDIDLFFPFVLGVTVLFLAYSLPLLNNFSLKADYTYGIYLYHFPIIQLFVYFEYFQKYNPLFVGIITMLTTYVCAYLSWHLIEKKFLNRK